MPLCNRAGTWGAYPASIVINETGPNNLATAVIKYEIIHEADGPEWVDVSAEKMEITGYHYFEKKGKENQTGRPLNTSTIDQFQDAFPNWTADKSMWWLQDNARDLAGDLVQITTYIDTYENKRRVKVGWLSLYRDKPSYGGGGGEPADSDTRQRISNRLQAKLRAHRGGGTKPVPPSKAAGRPSLPSRPKPPVPRKSEDAPPACTDGEAWAAFVAAVPAKWGDEETDREWFRILRELFGDEMDEATLSSEDWGAVKAKAPGMVNSA
ncbi:MAG: hypothetical protein HQ592_14320 [Planctomycetes bacterium]|nr:hypothetical protein [Planctomycetota bacterium]